VLGHELFEAFRVGTFSSVVHFNQWRTRASVLSGIRTHDRGLARPTCCQLGHLTTIIRSDGNACLGCGTSHHVPSVCRGYSTRQTFSTCFITVSRCVEGMASFASHIEMWIDVKQYTQQKRTIDRYPRFGNEYNSWEYTLQRFHHELVLQTHWNSSHQEQGLRCIAARTETVIQRPGRRAPVDRKDSNPSFYPPLQRNDMSYIHVRSQVLQGDRHTQEIQRNQQTLSQ
jgi:hypothetical protein